MGVDTATVRALAMSRWLGALDEATLADILVRRPEAAVAPLPRTLGDLAERLSQPHHAAAALTRLCAPAVQIVEVAQALWPRGGSGVTRADLGAMIGRDADDPELTAALEVLYQRALAWPDGDRVVLAGPLRNAFSFPLALGRPAVPLLNSRPLEEVRRIASRLGCRVSGRPKDDVVAAVAARLADAPFVRDLVDRAPGNLSPLLYDLAADSAVLSGEYGYLPPALRWPVEHGLLVTDGWSPAEMPREVGLALRGPGWRAPFDPHPPLPPLPVAEPGPVAREAAAALGSMLDGITAVVEAAPIALLKSGGVGVREVKRLARLCGADPLAVALRLEVAAGAGLLTVPDGLAVVGDEVLATPEFDAWAASAPADRVAALVQAWLEVPARPPGATPLRPDPVPEPLSGLRTVFLDVLAGLGGALPLDGALVPPLLAWHAPLALPEDTDEAAAVALQLWREAALLGLVAHGALSPLGRAAQEGADLSAAAAELVTAPAERAVFQADLTAVVAGSPAVDLARLLDSCADREARGTASVWRFSPESVRRALDGGISSAGLLDRLRSVGAVPQSLEYLVGDVARRHGALRVRAVGCVLRCEDTSLLKEVAADRRLGALDLTVLAPTALASARPPAETLAALRRAGYAPSGEDATGAALLELPPQRRAERPVPARRARRRPPSVRPEDALTLARRLLTAPRGGSSGPLPSPVAPVAPVAPPGDAREAIQRAARQLSPPEARRLADAMTNQEPVHIVYQGANGKYSSRIIDPLEIEDGYLLRAYCHMRDGERVFALARIRAVTEAQA